MLSTRLHFASESTHGLAHLHRLRANLSREPYRWHPRDRVGAVGAVTSLGIGGGKR